MIEDAASFSRDAMEDALPFDGGHEIRNGWYLSDSSGIVRTVERNSSNGEKVEIALERLALLLFVAGGESMAFNDIAFGISKISIPAF